MPVPTTILEVKQFTGLVQFCARFLPEMSETTQPLNVLTHGKGLYAPIECTKEAQAAFDKLKQQITNAPVLGIAKPNLGNFIDTCDASLYFIGVVLSQMQYEKEVILHYYSKKLTTLETNLCTTKRELLSVVSALKHFRLHLLGAPFVVRTDHASLQWLRSFRHVEGKLARWLERLAAYQFTIEYKKGTEIPHADALSRKPNRPCSDTCKKCNNIEEKEAAVLKCYRSYLYMANFEDTLVQEVRALRITLPIRLTSVAPGPHYTKSFWHKSQVLDPEVMPIYDAVAEGKRPYFSEIVQYSPYTRSLWHQFNSLTIREKVLCRMFEDISGDPNKIIYQTVVPTALAHPVARVYHVSPGTGSHFGERKCLQQLRNRFYWPRMHETVQAVVTTCEECTRRRGPKRTCHLPLKLFQEGVLHGRWHIDLCGPLPESEEGYKWICICIEAFSGWPEAIPLRTKNTKELAEALVANVFSRFGSPVSILTDQEKSMEAELMHQIMLVYGVDRHHTTVQNHKANGKVEVYIKTLKEHLGIKISKYQHAWPKHLHPIMQAYRAMQKDDTGYSPFEILFGRPMILPLDLLYGLPPGRPTSIQEGDDMHDYVCKLRQELDDIHHEVREYAETARMRMKLYYDTRASITPFQKGQKVWLYDDTIKKGESRKLTNFWRGPYVILKIINDCTARIMKLNVGDEKQTPAFKIVNMDRLAAYDEPEVPEEQAWITLNTAMFDPAVVNNDK